MTDNRTNEEIIALIQAGQDRQENLLALYNKNMPVIYKYCKQYSGRVEIADLLQESFLILAEAVDKYNLNSDYAFLTAFRYYFITHYERLIRPQETAIRLPVNFSMLIRRYKKMTRQYRRDFNQIPDDKQYCEALKITYYDLAKIRKHINDEEAYSLDYEYPGENGDSITLIELLEDPEDANEETLNREQQKELHDALEQILSKLPTENADVLREYFYNNVPLPSYAEKRGITCQAASLRKIKALERIRRQPDSIKRLRYFITPDEMRDFAYNYKSVRAFLSDRTSVTEQAALKIFDLERQKKATGQKQTSYYDHIGAKYMTADKIPAEA